MLPAMEKALLRSPEISLSGMYSPSVHSNYHSQTSAVIAELLPAYSHPVEGDAFRRLLTPALNNSKSSNHIVRASSIALFKVLIKLAPSTVDIEHAATELLSLPKAGKTAGPDHRMTLYTMLGAVPPSDSVSLTLVQTGLPLLAKETHDAAVSVLAASLVTHLVCCLRSGSSLPSDTAAIAAKEMTSTKPVVRRAFCSLVGSALWELGGLESAASEAFAKSIVPSFETNLKTVSANPVGAVAGPLEGYVATAVLLGPLARSKQFGSFSCCPSPIFFIPHSSSLQTMSFRAIPLCNQSRSRVRNPRSCCGIRSTRSSAAKMKKHGYSVLARLSLLSPRIRL